MENNIYSIYRIISPSNKIYIGQSKCIKRRLKDYQIIKNSVNQGILHRSFLKYGIENHKFQILFEECLNLNQANEKEIEFIKIYKDLNISLNIREGGNENVSHLKKSVIKFDLNKNFIKEYESVSEAALHNNLNTSNISHCIFNNLGYSGGFLWLFKKDYLDGKLPNWKNKGKSRFWRKVNKFTLKGEFIKSYINIVEAAKDSNVSDMEIRQNLKNKTKRAGNFIFSESLTVKPYRNTREKLIKLTNLETNEVFNYGSMKECVFSNKEFFHGGQILKGLRKNIVLKEKFKFEYLVEK